MNGSEGELLTINFNDLSSTRVPVQPIEVEGR